MKEIIIVTNNLAEGGAERVLSELISEWIKNDCEVTILQVRPNEFADSFEFPEETHIININSVTQNRFLRRFIQAYQLIKIFNSKKDATILAFLEPSMLLVGVCSPFIKNKIVFSERNDPDRSPVNRFYRLVRDNVFRLADACVFQTQDAKEHFCQSVQKKSTIIPNPINDKLPEPYTGKRKKTIVAVCRLAPQKNLPMTIQAFKELSSDYPDYILEIYGRGELENELKELIQSLNLQERVFLMGFSHNVYEKMYDAAIYVSSSNYEGISNSMLEALCMGIPTICTDCPCGGARMFIKNDENGLLVPVGDTNALYVAMKKILDRQDFADKISRNACEIRNELSAEKIANQWMDILK